MPAKYRSKFTLGAGSAPLQMRSLVVLLVIAARFGGGTGTSEIDQDVVLRRRLGVGRGIIHQRNNASKTRNPGAANTRTERRTESNDTSAVHRFVCVLRGVLSIISWPPGMCSFYVSYSKQCIVPGKTVRWKRVREDSQSSSTLSREGLESAKVPPTCLWRSSRQETTNTVPPTTFCSVLPSSTTRRVLFAKKDHDIYQCLLFLLKGLL